MAPGIGRGGDAVVTFFHLHYHHFDGNDRVVDQQPKRQDQRAQRDAVEILAAHGHDHKDHRQGQRYCGSYHYPHAPAHADEAHQHDDQQRNEELDHELIDCRADIDGLVRDFTQTHAQRQLGVDRACLVIQRLAQVETVPAITHDNPQQQCRLAAVANHERCRIFVATLDRGNVRQLERAALCNNRRVADLLQLIERTVKPNENLRPSGFDRPCCSQRILVMQRSEYLLRADTQCCQPFVRELDINSLWLLADDIDLLHARHMQQALAHGFGFTHEHALRFALGLEREQRKGNVRVLVIDHWPDDPGRKGHGFIAYFLARLIKLVRYLRWRRTVEQRQGGERQAGACVGFRAVIPTQFLKALFYFFCHLILHLLGGRSGPDGYHGHHLDRERRVFRASQFEEGNDPRQ
ncbi:hypothetical protein ALP22_05585 [Pseudomonas coronafaciens pv. porri]|nr:hypothetical protein ALP22_05585 [Pseudomonas coronafaciens pv. porri]RMV95497.1 hypothetical protein ALP00_05442 [Pseudomonas coronafaciens pv. porri]